MAVRCSGDWSPPIQGSPGTATSPAAWPAHLSAERRAVADSPPLSQVMSLQALSSIEELTENSTSNVFIRGSNESVGTFRLYVPPATIPSCGRRRQTTEFFSTPWIRCRCKGNYRHHFAKGSKTCAQPASMNSRGDGFWVD